MASNQIIDLTILFGVLGTAVGLWEVPLDSLHL